MRSGRLPSSHSWHSRFCSCESRWECQRGSFLSGAARDVRPAARMSSSTLEKRSMPRCSEGKINNCHWSTQKSSRRPVTTDPPPPPHPPLTYLHRILSCILDVVFVSFKGPDDVGPELGHDLEETPKRGNQPSCDLLFPRIVFGCSFQCDPGTWKTALKQIWPNKSF